MHTAFYDDLLATLYFKQVTVGIFAVNVVIHLKCVATVRFEAVCHFDAVDGVLTQQFGREVVEQQFDVAYGVDVPVDVEVGVGCFVCEHEFGIFMRMRPIGAIGDGRSGMSTLANPPLGSCSRSAGCRVSVSIKAQMLVAWP